MTEQQLASTLAAVVGTSFVGLTTRTVPRLKGGKGNPMQGRVEKITETVCFCGGAPSYGRMMSKRAAAEFAALTGERPVETVQFEPQALWKGKGEHCGGALVRHVETDKKYLMAYFANNAKAETRYELAGQPIDKADIIGLETADDEKIVIVEGVECAVKFVVRTYAVSSIESVRIDGEEFTVDHAAPIVDAPITAAPAPVSEPANA